MVDEGKSAALAIEDRDPPRGQRTAANRWREVVDSSARLFYERGYESTSVNDIATALGITKGSLYHYIASKDDLLFAIIDDIHRLTEESLLQHRQEEGDALSRLWLYFTGHVRLNIDHLHASTLIYRDMDHLDPERRRRIVAIRDELQDHVRGLVETGITEGSVQPDLDVRLASFHMFGVANGIYQWFRPQGEENADLITRSVATFIIRGVSARPWSPPER